MSLDSSLLEIIVCPECKGCLQHKSERRQLICPRCRQAYPINDHGVPMLIADEAIPLDPYESAELADL